jgi:hypothetical protein
MEGIRRGYPPEGADAPFPLKSWRISGYPKGYLPIQEALRGPQAVRNKTKKHGFCCAAERVSLGGGGCTPQRPRETSQLSRVYPSTAEWNLLAVEGVHLNDREGFLLVVAKSVPPGRSGYTLSTAKRIPPGRRGFTFSTTKRKTSRSLRCTPAMAERFHSAIGVYSLDGRWGSTPERNSPGRRESTLRGQEESTRPVFFFFWSPINQPPQGCSFFLSNFFLGADSQTHWWIWGTNSQILGKPGFGSRMIKSLFEILTLFPMF